MRLLSSVRFVEASSQARRPLELFRASWRPLAGQTQAGPRRLARSLNYQARNRAAVPTAQPRFLGTPFLGSGTAV